MSDPAMDFHVSRVDLIERYAAVLYPVDVSLLLDRLPEKGWVVHATMSGGNVLADGQLATRGNVQLVISTDNKTLGVRGNDPTETVQAYRELQSVTQQISRFPPGVSTDYVEVRYVGWAERGSNPSETLASWWDRFDALRSLSKIASDRLPVEGGRFAQYAVRLTPFGQDAQRQNWAELLVSPQSTSGHSRYHFDLIYRHGDSAVAEKVAEGGEDLVKAILDHIEQT